jgi:hypothetical protein
MLDKYPGVINYLIGVALMLYILFALRNKSIAQPDMKVIGLPIKTIFILLYIGIFIDVALVFVTLVK